MKLSNRRSNVGSPSPEPTSSGKTHALKRGRISVITVIFSVALLSIYLTEQLSVFTRRKESRLTPSTGPWPHIAWLMTFPYSGEVYLADLVQSGTGSTTATNYGSELEEGYESFPELSYSKNGPYRASDLAFPADFILTTTYCSEPIGTGMFEDIKVPDWGFFLKYCASGTKPGDDNRSIQKSYDITSVKRALHLIRDPFDSIVAHYHAEKLEEDPTWDSSFDKVGFRAWCHKMDNFFADEKELEDLGLGKNVPCHGQFYKFIKWHNNAFDVAEIYKLPILTIHYNDFRDNIGGTITKFFNFLVMNRKIQRFTGTYPSFEWTGYSNYYSDRERANISEFVHAIASQTTWSSMKRYLPLTPTAIKGNIKKIAKVLSPYYGEWPATAWLLAFPNSGTFFTTSAIQIRARVTTATNYGTEVTNQIDLPNFACSANGPFRSTKRRFPKDFILTKTHGEGRCTECSPYEYIKKPEEFMKGALRTSWFLENGEIAKGSSSRAAVKRVIHLFRNPFDNVVSRFHYVYKKRRAEFEDWHYQYGREGFRKWCQDQDQMFKREENRLYTPILMAQSEKVLCHAEFYKFVQWHNNAFITAKTMKILQLVVHYEDYDKDLEGTISKMNKFLHLEEVGRFPAFIFLTYPDFFTAEEKLEVEKFIRMLGLDSTIKEVERYL